MRLSMRLLLMLSFVIALLPTPALAGDPLARPVDPKACEHLDRGNNLYDAGSFKEAIDEYKAGETIEPDPVFDFNLGQAQRQLGMYREALWHYDRFIHKGQPTGRLRAAVVAFMDEMRTHLENKAQSMPPTGREPSGEPIANPPSATTVPAHSSLIATPPASPTGSTVDVTRPIDRDESPDWIGWSATGSGVAALAISGVLFYRASQLNNQGDSESNMETRQHLYDQANSRDLAGAIVAISGAALTAVGVIRLTLHHRARTQASIITINVSSYGVLATGAF